VAAEFTRHTGLHLSVPEIAAAGTPEAKAALERLQGRLARSLASVVNILDPDVIVLGGGLSNLDMLYRELPQRVEACCFLPQGPIRIVRNQHGDSSGVRGAAWLWPQEP
jgi:fructokinase